jgi:hypothetical protein
VRLGFAVLVGVLSLTGALMTGCETGGADISAPCSPATCPDGCCQESVCRAGITHDACGSGGGDCTICENGLLCGTERVCLALDTDVLVPDETSIDVPDTNLQDSASMESDHQDSASMESDHQDSASMESDHCSDESGAPDEETTCAPQDHKQCRGDTVYWFDSCGAPGSKVSDCPYGCLDGACKDCVPFCAGKECGDNSCGGDCGTCSGGRVCESGACICKAHDHLGCHSDGDVYWFNSCGSREDLAANCDFGEICEDGACACRTQDRKVCKDNAVYWLDSCGHAESVEKQCSASEVCLDFDYSCHSLSGLTWADPSSEEIKHFSAVESHCASLGDGWRVPTISELRTLIRGCESSETMGSCGVTNWCLSIYEPCLNDFCEGCAQNGGPANGCYWPDGLMGTCGRYWSSSVSTSYYGSDIIKFGVYFPTGRVLLFDDRYSTAYVRCVR